jgi:hypothetical protein
MKPSLKTRTCRQLASAVLPLVIIAVGLPAYGAVPTKVISVNFYEFDNDIQKIDGDETFGVGDLFGIETTVGKWINTNMNSKVNLGSTDGPTTVGLVITQPNGQGSFNPAYDDTPVKSGLDVYPAGLNTATAAFSDLSANFPDGYFAIVYLTGFNGNDGASISDGTSTFYYRNLDTPVAPVTYVQTTQETDLGDNANPQAQYAVFGSLASPLTADSITFTLTALYDGGAALGGVQIVGIPVPVITDATVNGSNEFVIDFTAAPSSSYEVKKSAVLSSFASLSVPLSVSTDGNGVGQVTVPAGEMAGAKKFFVIETVP